MNDSSQLDAACRLALAAFLHDVGKFAERARIDYAQEKDLQGNTRADINKQLYCPQWDNRYTHVHAAYTAMSIDLLEEKGLLPPLKGYDVSPFKSWKSKDSDESLINAAAKHHKPDTALQWVIASADRIASGFEREEYDRYNQSEERRNHYTTRQWTLFEHVNLSERLAPIKEGEAKYRYPLKPLSVSSLFPQKRQEVESEGNIKAQQEYLTLWQGFLKSMTEIPTEHQGNLPLWMDHFETLWGTYAHAIPSATAGKTRPDVSLYDHSRTTAALAVALWKYHQDHDAEKVRSQLRAQWDMARQEHENVSEIWAEEKFLMIQGDFFGIQNFIFSSGSETQKNAAKLLRGRSFYVSLMTECAALKVLEALDLPPTSQVINAAGKFLIVAANTQATRDKLKRIQKELDDWFHQHCFAESGIGIAWLSANSNDFRKSASDEISDSSFAKLMKRLFEVAELRKYQRMAMTEAETKSIFSHAFEGFHSDKGVCAVDNRSPGEVKLRDTDHYISQLASDQIKTGSALVKNQRLLIASKSLPKSDTGSQLELSIFGYFIGFENSESEVLHQDPKKLALRRCFDFSLPENKDATLWDGFSRRYINAYVPIFDQGDLTQENQGRYSKVNEGLRIDDIKSLNHIAQDDKRLDSEGQWKSQSALMTLKGDVDNLGMVFQHGLGAPTFARMAGMSRQMNAFFSVYLPYLCDKEFKSTYTVFAGGDDFFLIGPWHSTMKLALKMRREFDRYVAHNPHMTFSAGLAMTKPGLPIRYLAEQAEAALEASKTYVPKSEATPPKNRVTCFERSVSWADFAELFIASEALASKREQIDLSTGYIYGLLQLIDMREELEQGKLESAMWRSYFSYRTWRFLERKKTLNKNARRKWHQLLGDSIAENGIEKYKGDYRIVLFTHLYQQRH